jgi:hypothetical protein
MNNHHKTTRLSFVALRSFRLKGLWGIYLNTAFRDLGLNLIGVFLPIFVYKTVGNLPLTFLFFVIYHFVVLPSDWLAGKLAQSIGLDMLEFLSAVLRSLFLICLMLAPFSWGFLWLAAVLYGMTIPFCWIPYYMTISERVDHKHYGETIGKLDVITSIMGGIGPFAGGLIILTFGFNMLFFITVSIFLLSGLVVFLDDFDRKHMRFNFGKMMKRFTRPGLRRFWLGKFGNAVEETVYTQAWFLFIFLTVSSYTVLGGIQSVSLLVSIIVAWMVGKWVDKKGPQILNYGVVGNVLNWLLRPFLISGFFIFLADLAYRILTIFIWTPFMAVTYKHASDCHKLEFFVQGEWVYHTAGLLTSAFMMIISTQFNLSWSAIFSLAILGLLMCTLVITPGVIKKR